MSDSLSNRQPCPFEVGTNATAATKAAAEQRKKQHCEQMTGIVDIETTQELHTQQLKHVDDRFARIETKIDFNNAATEEVLAILTLGKAFFKLADYFGIVVKWVLGISTAVVAFWLMIKSGGKP